MKTRKLLTTVLVCLVNIISFAQITDTIQVSKDAMMREFAGAGDNTNYGNYALINMHAGTNGGDPVVHRSLVDFDLSNIPSGSTIVTAELQLFSDENSSIFPGGHDVTNGPNACLVRRVISNWTENNVTWNNQPATSTVNQTIIPQSISNYQDYIVNVTSLVQEMVDDPNNSFGFRIALQDENYYRRMLFASSDNVDESIHPKLIITYNTTIGIEDGNNYGPTFSLYPNPSADQSILTIDGPANYTFRLFDSLGRLVLTIMDITSGEVLIRNEGLASGLYFFQLESDGHLQAYGRHIIE